MSADEPIVTTARRVMITLGFVLGAFFIIRAIVELVTIDYSDPSSYAADWGGPSLVYFWRRLHPSGERSAASKSSSSS